MQPQIDPHTYTEIEGVGFVCNDCGAHAETPEEVVHYPTCDPGESNLWQQLFNETDPDEDEQADREAFLEDAWDDPADDPDLWS